MQIRLDKIGARQAVHDAYAVQMNSKPWNPLEPSISGTKNISEMLAWNGLQAGKVIAVVEALPTNLKNWVIWAYGPRVEVMELPAQGAFFGWLCEQVDHAMTESNRTYRDAVRGKIRDLIAYAAIDYRHYLTTEQRLYPVSELKKRCKIRHDTWQRDFSPWYRLAGGLFERLDREALSPVGSLLKCERVRLLSISSDSFCSADIEKTVIRNSRSA